MQQGVIELDNHQGLIAANPRVHFGTFMHRNQQLLELEHRFRGYPHIGAIRPRLHRLNPLSARDRNARIQRGLVQQHLKIRAMVQQERVVWLQRAEIQIQNAMA